MIYKASNYMEGIDNHFQANQVDIVWTNKFGQISLQGYMSAIYPFSVFSLVCSGMGFPSDIRRTQYIPKHRQGTDL